jgi:hypothetical protein
MIEPVLTPNVTPQDSQLHPSAQILTLQIRRQAAVPSPADRTPVPADAASAAAPSPTAVTVRSRPAAPRREDPEPDAAVIVTAPPAAPPPRVCARLVVLRGQRIGAEFPVYPGRNTIGRFVEKPVDIDLLPQEAEYQVWCSRLHAVVTFDKGAVVIEDLNSLNGTWVNGARVPPGHLRLLRPDDVVQIGTVQMRLEIG